MSGDNSNCCLNKHDFLLNLPIPGTRPIHFKPKSRKNAHFHSPGIAIMAAAANPNKRKAPPTPAPEIAPSFDIIDEASKDHKVCVNIGSARNNDKAFGSAGKMPPPTLVPNRPCSWNRKIQ